MLAEDVEREPLRVANAWSPQAGDDAVRFRESRRKVRRWQAPAARG
jgi:hypothetical protein